MVHEKAEINEGTLLEAARGYWLGDSLTGVKVYADAVRTLTILATVMCTHRFQEVITIHRLTWPAFRCPTLFLHNLGSTWNVIDELETTGRNVEYIEYVDKDNKHKRLILRGRGGRTAASHEMRRIVHQGMISAIIPVCSLY